MCAARDLQSALVPTYSYACKDCGHQFDIVQAFSDNALTDCPECGGGLRKVFNSVGVVFKGSGFYRTDSRGSSSTSSTTSSTTDTTTAKAESSSETKKPAPEKKPTAKSSKPTASTD